uniref:Uncharacterized protein n=1 Tax=Anopheles darlingi TaxID=43151 RepID=A0A2M4CWR5_ANODA
MHQCRLATMRWLMLLMLVLMLMLLLLLLLSGGCGRLLLLLLGSGCLLLLLLPLALLELESLVGLLPGTELCSLELLQVELLPLLDQLLPLVFESLPFPFHRRFQFFEVAQLDLQFFHLRLNQQRHQALDLTFLHRGQMLRFDGGSS